MRAYLAGVSLENFARGNRRMLAAVKARREQRVKQAKKAARKAAEKAQKAGEKPDSAAPAAEPRRTVPVWERAAWSAGGLFLLWPTIGPAVPVTLGTLVTVWVVAALIAGQEDGSSPAATATDAPAAKPLTEAIEDDRDRAEEAHQEQPDPAPAATVPTPADARRAVAILGADGTHVSLTAVTAHLAAAHPLWKRSGKAVRALLREARVEVRGGVRVEGVSVPGIHHDDVPLLPSPSEGAPGGVVVAGQSNNNNVNNANQWSIREGFVMRAHPDDPARTIVVHASDAA